MILHSFTHFENDEHHEHEMNVMLINLQCYFGICFGGL